MGKEKSDWTINGKEEEESPKWEASEGEMVCSWSSTGYHGSDLRANPFEEEEYDAIMVDEPSTNPRSSFKLV